MSARGNATTSNVFDENERLKDDANVYFSRVQEQASLSIDHDELTPRAPEVGRHEIRYPSRPDLTELGTYIDSSTRFATNTLDTINEQIAHLHRELDIIVNGTPKNGPDTSLFDNENNTVNFNDIEKGTYLDGTQYSALKGNDTVILPNNVAEADEAGFDPNHYFVGGNGNDKIFSDDLIGNNDGVGLDNKIDGSFGNDFLSGGAGNDEILGGAGNDILLGGDGDDVIYCSFFQNSNVFDNDIALGGNGDDIINGDSAGRDVIQGEAGNDKLFGDQGDDLLSGGTENDFLSGGHGNDQLYGNEGNDILIDCEAYLNNDDNMIPYYDGDGQDILNGGSGDDILVVGLYDEASDLVIGGSGSDIFSLYVENPQSMTVDKCDVIVDFENGKDTINFHNIDGENYFNSFNDLKIIDVNGDSYIFGKESNLPIVIVKNGAGLLDASDFTFKSLSYEVV